MAGKILSDLEDALRDKGRFGQQEQGLLFSVKGMAMRSMLITAIPIAAVTWFATRRLGNWYRFNLVTGTTMLGGMYTHDTKLYKGVERILTTDKSHVQKELLSILITKYKDTPWMKKFIQNHFFAEELISDSDPDKISLKWRRRRSFVDNAFSETYDTITSASPQIASPIGDIMADPLECIYGSPESNKDGSQSEDKGVPSKRRARAHRRAHRHHHHHGQHTEDAAL